MVVFVQKLLYSGESGCIREKVVVFVQSGFIAAKEVVFGQKWLYLGKSGFILAKVVVFGQNFFYSAKLFCSSNSCCIRTKCL